MEESREIQDKAYGRSDGKGRRTKVTLWNRATDDLAGVVARYIFIFESGKKISSNE